MKNKTPLQSKYIFILLFVLLFGSLSVTAQNPLTDIKILVTNHQMKADRTSVSFDVLLQYTGSNPYVMVPNFYVRFAIPKNCLYDVMGSQSTELSASVINGSSNTIGATGATITTSPIDANSWIVGFKSDQLVTDYDAGLKLIRDEPLRIGRVEITNNVGEFNVPVNLTITHTDNVAPIDPRVKTTVALFQYEIRPFVMVANSTTAIPISNFSGLGTAALSSTVQLTVDEDPDVLTSKPYDGNNSVNLLSHGNLLGIQAGHTVTLTASATYDTKDVGTGKTITVKYTLGGASAQYYSAPNNFTITNGVITKIPISITGVSAVGRTYNALTTVGLTGTPTLSGKIGSDIVTIGGTPSATIATKTIGTGKPVTVTGYTISGSDAANYNLSQPSGLTVNITACPLTITGLSGSNKVYDATINAPITGTAVLTPKQGSDIVNISAVGTGAFANKSIGTSKPITVTGYTITGLDAGNYTLTQPTGLTASITAAPLTITGLSGVNKVYNASVNATLTGTATLNGKQGSDLVYFTGTPVATFATKVIGTNKDITVTGYSIDGTDAGNYTLSQPTGLKANITAAPLTITGLSGVNKVYDATTTAPLSGTATLNGKQGSDVVSLTGTPVASFATKIIGTDKGITVSGYSVTGDDAGNYTLSQPTGLKANITAAPLTITGLSAVDKVYDATTTASLSGTATLNGKQGSDVISLTGTPVATFATKHRDTNKNITVSGYSITGTDAGNYTLSQPTGLTANITAAPLTITGLSAVSKVYDAETTATLSGTAVLSGKQGSDVVNLSGTPIANFATKAIGTDKAVTVVGYWISGDDYANYTYTQPTGLKASITAAPLTITGISASNKTYNASTTATITGTAQLSGIKGYDLVSLSGTPVALFADKNIGTGKSVSVSGYVIGNTDAANYTLTQPTLSANITAANMTISGINILSKEYDGTATATITGTPTLNNKQGSDVVSLSGTPTATFINSSVGTGKAITVSGYALSGGDAGNYTLSQPSGFSANINKRQLSINTPTVKNKIYDGTDIAPVYTGGLTNVVGSESVTVTASAKFGSTGVGTNIPISVTYAISGGTNADNYTAPVEYSTTGTIFRGLNMKIVLEGFWDDGTKTMKTCKLKDGVTDRIASIVDEVTIELRSLENYATVVKTYDKLLLKTDGTLVSPDGFGAVAIDPSISSKYYITVKHRNSLPITTGSTVSFSANTIETDFMTSSSGIYTTDEAFTPLKLRNGVWMLYSGDVYDDGAGYQEINIADVYEVFNHRETSVEYLNADLNGDANIDDLDVYLAFNSRDVLLYRP